MRDQTEIRIELLQAELDIAFTRFKLAGRTPMTWDGPLQKYSDLIRQLERALIEKRNLLLKLAEPTDEERISLWLK